jgi:hypothetical protein
MDIIETDEIPDALLNWAQVCPQVWQEIPRHADQVRRLSDTEKAVLLKWHPFMRQKPDNPMEEQ